MKRLRKLVKKILQSWRKFRRRKLKKSLKDWELFSDLLGRFETSYDLENKSHEINMELINKEINGTIVMPGEIFSFNKNVGERTEEKGYKSGPVYVRGRLTKDIGGGISQGTTGLYIAAIFSNMKILKRKSTHKVSKYTLLGMDSTVYWGLIDLVFKNTRKYPIKIMMYLDKVNGTHVFEMWGRNSEKINVKLSQKIKENKKEIIVTTYREIYKEQRLIKKEKLSKDKYKKN